MQSHHKHSPPASEKKVTPQYNTDSDRVGTYRLMGRLQGKDKSEVVPNNIAVSDPSIIAGFRDKYWINKIIKQKLKISLPPNLPAQGLIRIPNHMSQELNTS